MKTFRVLSLAFLLLAFFTSAGTYGQKVGVAADKQKQENLEKNKKRQAELKKKYNSLTPEQAAEAERKANEYKKSGGKTKPAGNTAKPATGGTKPGTGTAVSKTSQTPKQGNVQKPGATKQPVWMDANGKPKPVNSGKTTGKQEAKPGTVVKATPKTTTAKPVSKSKVASEKQATGTKK
jgi:hypothetical protein